LELSFLPNFGENFEKKKKEKEKKRKKKEGPVKIQMQHIACLNQANQPVFYLSIYPQRSYVLIGGA
jgi:hypothetical protein